MLSVRNVVAGAVLFVFIARPELLEVRSEWRAARATKCWRGGWSGWRRRAPCKRSRSIAAAGFARAPPGRRGRCTGRASRPNSARR